ncbi:hypothetical protein GCM10010515_12300 [Streptomyces fructofermentans]|uniref:Uncharacterized protein n=1 Tax=Streptomyces fructofermentans TaxID=152141 RepID=A0A918K3H7_9ACTN|nr:hypothetical protein GCM10010515_12300 [Streptomyces fructofermentans]
MPGGARSRLLAPSRGGRVPGFGWKGGGPALLGGVRGRRTGWCRYYCTSTKSPAALTAGVVEVPAKL